MFRLMLNQILHRTGVRNNPRTLKNETTIRCSLAIQSSQATLFKIKSLANKYISNPRPNFHTFLVLSKDVKTSYNAELFCDCDDERLSKHGLPCRLDCAINYFYYNLSTQWIFVGGDDDWINFDALEKFIDALEISYDPQTQNIFAGNLQQMYNMSFPHGGPGWLASRKFIGTLLSKGISAEAVSRRYDWVTDDVAMGIVLRESFPDLHYWASPWTLVALPASFHAEAFRTRRWHSFPTCPNDVERASVRDIFSVHMTPFKGPWLEAVTAFEDAPPWLKIVTEKFTHTSFCACHNRWCNLEVTPKSVQKRLKPLEPSK